MLALKFRKHPASLSSLFFAFATLVIHMCGVSFDGMGNPVTLRYPRGPDSSMVEHLVQFQRGLGSSPGPVTFHAAISLPVFSIKLATETVVLGSFVRLVLTSTLMRPLRIWT